jgi:hypothetical protein
MARNGPCHRTLRLSNSFPFRDRGILSTIFPSFPLIQYITPGTIRAVSSMNFGDRERRDWIDGEMGHSHQQFDRAQSIDGDGSLSANSRVREGCQDVSVVGSVSPIDRPRRKQGGNQKTPDSRGFSSGLVGRQPSIGGGRVLRNLLALQDFQIQEPANRRLADDEASVASAPHPSVRFDRGWSRCLTRAL